MDYLKNKPIRIYWKVVAGGELTPIQRYDVIFDENDLKKRQILTEDNLIYLHEVQKEI